MIDPKKPPRRVRYTLRQAEEVLEAAGVHRTVRHQPEEDETPLLTSARIKT